MGDPEFFCLIVRVSRPGADDGFIMAVGNDEYIKKMYRKLGLALTGTIEAAQEFFDFGIGSIRKDSIIGYSIRSFENIESDESRLKASQMYADRQVLGL